MSKKRKKVTGEELVKASDRRMQLSGFSGESVLVDPEYAQEMSAIRFELDKKTMEDIGASGILDGAVLDWPPQRVHRYLRLIATMLRNDFVPVFDDYTQEMMEEVAAAMNVVQFVWARSLVNMPRAHEELRGQALTASKRALRNAIRIMDSPDAAPRDRLNAIQKVLDVAGLATPRRIELDVSDRVMDAVKVEAALAGVETEKLLEAARALGLPEADIVGEEIIVEIPEEPDGTEEG